MLKINLLEASGKTAESERNEIEAELVLKTNDLKLALKPPMWKGKQWRLNCKPPKRKGKP